MPLYEYVCGNCGARVEAIQKFSDAPLVTCPTCGADALSRMVSAPAITFKGSGWYITDYSAKGRQENTSPSSQREGNQKEVAPTTGTATSTSDAKSSAQAA
ncbi:MAG: FmdB family zinc ribbon protein [Acidobacteriota bacterium]